MFENTPPDLMDLRGKYQVNNGESNSVIGKFNLRYSKNTDKNYYSGAIGFNISQRKFQEIFTRPGASRVAGWMM